MLAAGAAAGAGGTAVAALDRLGALDAPGKSADWYRAVVGFAQASPGWIKVIAEIGTEAGLLLFAVLFLAAWWRARRHDARRLAIALLGPVVTVGAYLVSETSKTLFDERRPCRTLADAVTTIAHCPPVGDWSFPSNHATIAGAAAIALVLAWRALTVLVLPWAALLAFSRVFVGVHYPHDAAAGLILGAIVGSLLLLALAPALAPLVVRLREHRLLRPVLSAGPSPGGAHATRPKAHRRDTAPGRQ